MVAKTLVRREAFRIRIKDTMGNLSYLVRMKDSTRVDYRSASEVPLALSNCFMTNAAEARFALEDARYASDAYNFVRKTLSPRIGVELLP
jgi:hypothetical protein